jgi:uncharacterized protein YndB with AHSA1/START domain
MSTIATSGPTQLSFARIIDVPVQKVWQAWTVPERLMPWFCPKPWQVTQCEIDLRPGGVFRTLMNGPAGEVFDHVGCYLVVEHERKLVWTDALQPGYAPALKPWCTCVVEFEALDAGRTRYTASVLHADAKTCEAHAKMGFPEGWFIALDQMIAMINETN